jgi:hypothetical protein
MGFCADFVRISINIYRCEEGFQLKLERKQKTTFYTQYVFPTSLAVFEISKQMWANTLELLRLLTFLNFLTSLFVEFYSVAQLV